VKINSAIEKQENS